MAEAATLTKPVAPMLPASDPPALTHEVFLQHMTAMKGHYKSTNSPHGTGPSHAYALPVHLTVAAAKPPTDGTAEVNVALAASKNSTNAFAQDQTNAVNTATNKLQGDHNTSAFAAAMNAQRQKAKADSDKRIDDTFNNLIEVGTKYPAQQQHILSLTQQIGAFFTNILGKVVTFFTDIYNKIVGWINSAVDWIKGAAEEVGNWLSGAASSIAGFFAGL
jgi:hypothetical protein